MASISSTEPQAAPSQQNPKSWEEVRADPKYSQLPFAQREEVRKAYFDQVVSPNLKSWEIDNARQDFDKLTFEPEPSLKERASKAISEGLDALAKGAEEVASEAGKKAPEVIDSIKKFHEADQERSRTALAPNQQIIWGHIDSAAERYGVPVGVARNVAREESGYNTHAVSDRGAKGIMQLMDATAKQYGVKDSFDPWQNIHGGVKFLRDLFDKYDGDQEKAIAAYNWGPSNVDAAVSKYGDNWKQYAPKETRNYLYRVLGTPEDGAPANRAANLHPDIIKTVQQAFDMASPKTKLSMLQRDDYVGDIVRERAGVDAAPTEDLGKSNLDLFGRPPGEATSTDFDFEQASKMRNAGTVERGINLGGQQLNQYATGAHRVLAELATGLGLPGAKEYKSAAMQMRRNAAMEEQEIGDPKNSLESIISSTVSNLPIMASGLGGAVMAPTIAMGAQVGLDEYDNGIKNGLTPKQAAARSVLYWAAESLGEAVGFKGSVDLMKRAITVKGIEGATDQFVKDLGKNIAEQVTGEVGTTTAEDLTDKTKSLGLRPGMTLKDYVEDVKDTIVQTVGQTILMAGPGGGRAVLHGANLSISGESRTGIRADSAQEKAQQAWSEKGLTPSTRAEKPVIKPLQESTNGQNVSRLDQPKGSGIVPQGEGTPQRTLETGNRETPIPESSASTGGENGSPMAGRVQPAQVEEPNGETTEPNGSNGTATESTPVVGDSEESNNNGELKDSDTGRLDGQEAGTTGDQAEQAGPEEETPVKSTHDKVKEAYTKVMGEKEFNDPKASGIRKTAEKMAEAIDTGNAVKLAEILSPLNKKSRMAFKHLYPDVKLPNTLKGIDEAVNKFFSDRAQQPKEDTNVQEMPSTTSEAIPPTDAEGKVTPTSDDGELAPDTKVLKTYKDVASNVEIRIAKINQGKQFSVTVKDLDSGNALPVAKIFNNESEAWDYYSSLKESAKPPEAKPPKNVKPDKPKGKAPKPPKQARQRPKLIGQNKDGKNIYEKENGHRGIEEIPGIVSWETVGIRPTREGVAADLPEHTEEYLTKKERADLADAKQGLPTEQPTEQTNGVDTQPIQQQQHGSDSGQANNMGDASGESGTTPEPKPQGREALKGIKIKVKAIEAETGKVVHFDEDAETALKDIEDRIDFAKRLRECLES